MATSARGSDSEGRLPSSSQTRACNQALVPWSIAGGAAVARLDISMENRKSRRMLQAKSENPHVRERRFSVARIAVKGFKWRGVPVMRSMRSRLASKGGVFGFVPCPASGMGQNQVSNNQRSGEYIMLAVQLFQFSAHRRRLVLLTGLTFLAMC